MAANSMTNGKVDTSAPITHEQAKTIGRIWAVESPPMVAFIRSGEIGSELISSLVADMQLLDAAVSDEDAPPVVARAQLRALTTYMREYGPRGPQVGWHEVGQTDPVRGIIEPVITENFRRAQSRHEHQVAGRRDASDTGRLSLSSGPTPGQSVYLQLGAPAIADVVVTFYTMIMNDPALSPYFEGYDVEQIMGHQHAFLCVATGGPLEYLGRSIREAHAQIHVTNEHFDRVAEHLGAALAGAGVPGDIIANILAKVGAFRSHVVTS